MFMSRLINWIFFLRKSEFYCLKYLKRLQSNISYNDYKAYLTQRITYLNKYVYMSHISGPILQNLCEVVQGVPKQNRLRKNYMVVLKTFLFVLYQKFRNYSMRASTGTALTTVTQKSDTDTWSEIHHITIIFKTA